VEVDEERAVAEEVEDLAETPDLAAKAAE